MKNTLRLCCLVTILLNFACHSAPRGTVSEPVAIPEWIISAIQLEDAPHAFRASTIDHVPGNLEIDGDVTLMNKLIVNSDVKIEGETRVADVTVTGVLDATSQSGDVEFQNLSVANNLGAGTIVPPSGSSTVSFLDDVESLGTWDVSGTTTANTFVIDTLEAAGKAEIHHMEVQNNHQVLGDVVGTNFSVSGKLTVDGSSTLKDTNIGGTLTARRLKVDPGAGIDRITVDADMTVQGDVKGYGAISTDDKIVVDGSLTVTGPATFHNALTVSGQSGTVIKGPLVVNGDTTVTGSLTAVSDVEFQGATSVAGVTKLNGGVTGALTISGDTTLADGYDVVVTSTADVGYLIVGGHHLSTDGNGDLIISGTTVEQNLLLQDALTCHGGTFLHNVVTVVGDGKFKKDLNVDGDVVVGGDHSASGPSNVGHLVVNGHNVTGGTSKVNGDFTVDGNATLNGDVHVNNDLIVVGDHSVDQGSSDSLTINGHNVTVSDHSVLGDVTVSGSCTFSDTRARN